MRKKNNDDEELTNELKILLETNKKKGHSAMCKKLEQLVQVQEKKNRSREQEKGKNNKK